MAALLYFGINKITSSVLSYSNNHIDMLVSDDGGLWVFMVSRSGGDVNFLGTY